MRKIVIIIYLVLFVISCKDNISSDREAFLVKKAGKELLFPKETKVLSGDKVLFDSVSVFELPLKVVTYVDFSCGYCYNEIIELEDFINEFNIGQIGLIVYGYSENGFSGYFNFFSVYNEFSFPIFVDLKKEYQKINEIPNHNKYLETFLIGENDKILLAGNPLYDETTKESYIKMIKMQLKL